MEEVKILSNKDIKNLQGEEKNTEVVNDNKLSYEELNNVAMQLSQQNQQLINALQEANMVNAFKRLDYLFKVLEFGSKFDSDFVITCTDEIKGIMTISDAKTDTEEE